MGAHTIAKRGPLACMTAGQKACAVIVWAIISVLVGFAADYVAFCIAGPTSIGTWYNPYWIGFFALVCFIAGTFFIFRHDLGERPENLFLCIVLSMSCFSVWAFSINEISWDVGVHFEFALEYSEPDRVVELTQPEAQMAFLGYNRIEISLADLGAWEDQLNGQSDEMHGYVAVGRIMNLYKRVASLAASLLIMITEALGLPFTFSYVFAQLTFALIYSFVTFFGMRRLKSGKMLYAVIALLPTMLILATNYSYDYWVNAFSLFGMAFLIGELQRPDEKARLKDIILMLGSLVLGFGPKAIYFPLILMCLLIPKKKFSSVARSRIYRAAVIACSCIVAASFLLPMLIGGAGTGDARGGSDVNSTLQIAYILSNPFEYAVTLCNFLFSYYLAPLASCDYINYYAYLGHSSWIFWLLAAAAAIFTALTDKGPQDRYVNTWPARILVIVICAASVVLVATALYISFTAVGKTTIEGCQPRYLLPLVFPFLAFIGSYKLAWPTKAAAIALRNACVLALMAFIYLGGLWQVYVGLLM